MHLGIRAKQILGVTSIVGAVVLVMGALSLASLARVHLRESDARAELIVHAIYHRAREVVQDPGDPYVALRRDAGLRAILESSIYSKSVIDAAIRRPDGVAVAHSDPGEEGRPAPNRGDLSALAAASPWAQLRALYAGEGPALEVQEPLVLGDQAFGSIRVGMSTPLIRRELDAALRPAFLAALLALLVAVAVALVLAQVLLRPIHVIRSGLSRLGRGEFGVRLDLPQQDEFGELGSFFNSVSARLSADRTALAGQAASLQSAVEHLEDAVALVNAQGELLFVNRAMGRVLGPDTIGRRLGEVLATGHPYRQIVEEAIASGRSRGPVPVVLPDGSSDDGSERLVVAHAIRDVEQLVGIMLVGRDLAYLSQVQSSLRYSQKLVALGRLSAGLAHEVKNPLNAMTIHLELLRTKLTGGRAVRRPVAAAGTGLGLGQLAEATPADVTGALEHARVISDAIRRLDEVVQGFLRFTRPEDLRLQPVFLAGLLDEIRPLVESEADKARIAIEIDCPATLPDIRGDATMLRQALLNLAINACQAMPAGGRLRITGAPAPARRVEIRVEDTGVGIPPEHLAKIFDLYFTTKDHGSGIGLSMVYRIVQLHDGDVEVQSTPGRGTTFRLLLPADER